MDTSIHILKKQDENEISYVCHPLKRAENMVHVGISVHVRMHNPHAP